VILRLWLFPLAAVAVSSILAVSASTASAAVPPIPQNVPLKLKFRHSGMVANVAEASTQQGAGLIQWLDLSGFRNDDFKFVRVGGSIDRYNIQSARPHPSGLSLWLVPSHNGAGAQIVQRAWTNHSRFVWRVEEGDADEINLVNDFSGLAMNVEGGSLEKGARIIQWPQWFGEFFNDDMRILPAT
jgi:Ricin-type beta-trefoil lectin domain-like